MAKTHSVTSPEYGDTKDVRLFDTVGPEEHTGGSRSWIGGAPGRHIGKPIPSISPCSCCRKERRRSRLSEAAGGKWRGSVSLY